jgi:lipopolysaccharide transport system ATP-binding protein
MKNPVIIFDRVSKHYPLYHHFTGGIKNFLFSLPGSLIELKQSRFEAIRDISFEVYKGETFGIVGSNGAGKSTTLGLIAGIIKPNTGRVIVKGRISPLLALGAGFHPELTGKENIILNGVLMGLKRSEVSKKMDEIIEFSELDEFIDQPIRVYSSGMLARLGFSVIVHLDPEILLIDEILAVGDITFRKKCLNIMMGFKGKVTMVFVSHAMDTITKICDRVMWIDNHTINMMGDSKDVVSNYAMSISKRKSSS